MGNRIRYSTMMVLLAILLLALIIPATADELDPLDDYEPLIEQQTAISDPFEPVNRVFFTINDKLYFWVLNPASKVYGAVLPEDFRICLSNAFYNLLTPVRLVNNLLQGKIEQSGIELARFVINTTAGAAGLGDPAGEVFDLKASDEDLGQTLGSYGIGDGIYFCWPLFGPSNLRDTVGMVGDSLVNPLSHMGYPEGNTSMIVYGVDKVNTISLTGDQYGQFVESAFDPYVAMRDFYLQNRRSKVEDREFDGKSSQTEEMQPEAPAQIITQAPTASDSTAVNSSLGGKRFYIQVGTYLDMPKVQQVLDNLIRSDKKPLLVEYSQDDSQYYGIQVPAGSTMVAANFEDHSLNIAGFTETTIIAR